MFASFHSEGTIPSSSDKVNNFASGVLICSTISLSSFGGIPSTPCDLSDRQTDRRVTYEICYAVFPYKFKLVNCFN